MPVLKIFLLGTLLSLSTVTQAQAQAPEEGTPWESEDFRETVRDDTAKVLERLLFRAGECSERGMQSEVSRQTIRTIDALRLKTKDAQAAFIYLAIKAHITCLGDLPMEAAGYVNYARKLDVANFGPQSDPEFKQLEPALFNEEQRIKFDYLFRRLPKAQQQALEAIDELKAPFNIGVLSRIKTLAE